MNKYVFLPILFCCAVNASAIFENSTEDSTEKWANVSKPTAEAIVNSLEFREDLDQNIKEYGLSKDYYLYFVAKKIPLSDAQKIFFFVRPASVPYLSNLYGAHTFYYWLIDDSNKIIYSSNSDKFSILETSHHSMKDILVSNARSGWMYNSKFIFDGDKYKYANCYAYMIPKSENRIDCKRIPK